MNALLGALAGATLMVFILVVVSAVKAGWKYSGLHIIAYCLDMSMALVGFIFGFGLTVQNWWWVLLPMVVSRFSFHVLIHALHKK